jgi:biotin carboxyl carrier protein
MILPEYEVFVDGKLRKVCVTRDSENSFKIETEGKKRSVELTSNKDDFKKPFTVKIDGKNYKVELPPTDGGKELSVKVDEVAFKAEIGIPKRAALTNFEPVMTAQAKRKPSNRQVTEGTVTAPMTGKIVSVKVKKGDQVKGGQVLCVVEAMKMENEIASSKAGSVKEVYVSDGSSVSEGDPLFVIG